MGINDKISNASVVVSGVVGVYTLLEQITIIIWLVTAAIAMVINVINLEHKIVERKKRRQNSKNEK